MTTRVPDCKRSVHALDGDGPVKSPLDAQNADQLRADSAFERLMLLRKDTTLGGLSARKLRDKGRRRRPRQ
jgi:hypothetical protein